VLTELHHISYLTTIVRGERDIPFVEASGAMATTFAARRVTIPGAAHSPQHESAAAWKDAVTMHLDRANRS
jgi:pimeloyl-ACP methyl ester carboxylesterase